jgi:hypothetical protein
MPVAPPLRPPRRTEWWLLVLQIVLFIVGAGALLLGLWRVATPSIFPGM